VYSVAQVDGWSICRGAQRPAARVRVSSGLLGAFLAGAPAAPLHQPGVALLPAARRRGMLMACPGLLPSCFRC
jgi:hypothetical protein